MIPEEVTEAVTHQTNEHFIRYIEDMLIIAQITVYGTVRRFREAGFYAN